MKDTFDYEEPYDNVVRMGLVGLYKIGFEQAWRKNLGSVHCRNGTMWNIPITRKLHVES